MIINDDDHIDIDIINRIKAMRSQENATSACYNYFQRNSCKDVDKACRESMVVWCQQVQKALKLSPETVWIAISFFDRYLSSGKGKSKQALEDRYKFQLAAITSFYTAVKIYESTELNVVTLAKLCRGFYAESDIISMEKDILFALDWRVSCPTPMEFVRHLLELLPEKIKSSFSDSLLEASQKHMDHTATDFYFTFCKPSVIGASCLVSSLAGTDILSSSQRQTFWLQLSSLTDLIGIMEAQNRLLKGLPQSKPNTLSKLTKPSITSKSVTLSQPKSLAASGDSSPVCVTQTARQA
eukprot:CAMPEP_0172320742 /NCGR_PEP_ID=MMETSP1058-20130122/41293_1 /TAXON_ID=83371 /ORGANISM="Detonula confervacea, Strain CCMP 353" /LENGTH=296 /DNA_ID=CAMNT_0013036069 /DNA_START=131 /DNA_END=1021 /DNA_ORIENTATION=-